MTTIARIAIHAPCVNLVMSTTTSTVAVIARPTELMTRERFIRVRAAGSGSVRRCRVQCRTMPSWLTVNDTKTPTMYSWIRRVTSASNAQMSAIATSARVTMPLENASRSPRVCSWRGRYPSRARIEPSTGNPLNAVLAASTRISPVTTAIEDRHARARPGTPRTTAG